MGRSSTLTVEAIEVPGTYIGRSPMVNVTAIYLAAEVPPEVPIAPEVQVPPTVLPPEIITPPTIIPPTPVEVPPTPIIPSELIFITVAGVLLLIGGIAYLIYTGELSLG